MKKIIFLFFVLIATISKAQVNVVGYIQTNGVANYPTHIDSMGKGGYMIASDSNQRNAIPCLRRKFGMAVYVQKQQRLYILKDSSCNNVWELFTSGGGGGTQDLQSVLGYGHDLINGKNYQGTGAGESNTGINVNAFGTNAGKSNIADELNALGYNAGAGNTGKSVNALGNSAAFNNTGDYVNAFGRDTVAGYNTGVYVNAIGSGALYKNSGNYVNAFGGGAGVDNTHSNVNLFGTNANATEDNQLVLHNTIGYDARISYRCLDDNRDYRLPNKSGYFMTASVPTIIDASAHSSYNIPYADNYQVINLDADKAPMILYFPNPAGDECLIGGQRLVITNVTDNATSFGGKIDLDQTYPIYYRGTNIPITTIANGATAEFYSDGSAWRSISSIPEPAITLDMTALGDNYFIRSNGTYKIINVYTSYKIIFPPACYMEGEHITLINFDDVNSQSILPYPLYSAPLDCANTDIIDVNGVSITKIDQSRVTTFVAIDGKWIVISAQ